MTHSEHDALTVEELDREDRRIADAPRTNPAIVLDWQFYARLLAAARKSIEAGWPHSEHDALTVEIGRGLRRWLDKFGWHRFARERATSELAKHMATLLPPPNSEPLEEQKCRHDKAGSSDQGDYWYCDECGVEVEWIEGMGAGFWSPVSPAPAQSAEREVERLKEVNLSQSLQVADKLSEFVEAQATIADLVGALEKIAMEDRFLGELQEP